ncbi:MAG: hypothetical protein K8S55_02330, partial [Phycisphaerae bacterium]|nr:hypothetical protein [Phycisphaerae bacterium]
IGTNNVPHNPQPENPVAHLAYASLHLYCSFRWSFSPLRKSPQRNPDAAFFLPFRVRQLPYQRIKILFKLLSIDS